MSARITVDDLMEDLRSLAGVSSSVEQFMDEEVDWIIPTGSMDDEARDLLMRIGGKSVTEEKKIDARIKETVKGSLEILSKRIEGISDLVDMDKLGSVQTALEKVLKDGQQLLDSITVGEKKDKAQEKKDAKGQPEPKSQEDQKADKDDKKAKAPKVGSKAAAPNQGWGNQQSRGGATPRAGGSGSQQQVTMGGNQQESVVIVGSDVITESQVKDPFGLGESFKQDILHMTFGKKKR